MYQEIDQRVATVIISPNHVVDTGHLLVVVE